MSEFRNGLDLVQASCDSPLVDFRRVWSDVGFASRVIYKEPLTRDQIRFKDILAITAVASALPLVTGLVVLGMSDYDATRSQLEREAPDSDALKKETRAFLMAEGCLTPDSRYAVVEDGLNNGNSNDTRMKADIGKDQVTIYSIKRDDPVLRVQVAPDGGISPANDYTQKVLSRAGCDIR